MSLDFFGLLILLFPILFYLLFFVIMDSQKIVRKFFIRHGVLTCECFLEGRKESFLYFSVNIVDGLFNFHKTNCSLLVLRDEINICLAMCEQILSKD